MDLSGEYVIPQSQQRVWEAICDAEIVKSCIPGCEMMEKQSETEFSVLVDANVGSVRAQFKGRLNIADSHAPDIYTVVFEGQAPAGFVTGLANIELEPETARATRMKYNASVKIGGKLAQVSSRLLDGVGEKLVEQFFASFIKRLEKE